jgi:hypothetical protein
MSLRPRARIENLETAVGISGNNTFVGNKTFTGLALFSNAVVAAAGSSASDATAMTAQVNVVTGADGTKGVALPAAADQAAIFVVNSSNTNNLIVYPVSGGNDNINDLAEDAGITLSPGVSAWFCATSATQWYVENNAGNITSEIGAIASQPASGSVALSVKRAGNVYAMTFTLTAARLTVTDAAGSGSSGSLKIFDFVQGAILPLGSRQNYTAFAEGAALTGAAGDAAFVMALGSVAADAGDGALTGTEVDIAPATSTITLSGGTGTGTKMGGATAAPIDGTTTATDIYLNWSGTAATIDATSTIDVTGTITLLVAMLGDD